MTNTELLSKIKDFANEQKELLKGFELQSDFRRGETAAYSAILSFISTLELEKPVPAELEEAAHSYSESDEPLYSPGHRFHWDSDSLFGKQIETTFIAGAEWQNEQMMKAAVEGEVVLNPYPTICLDDCKDYDFKDGDKVRIIIIKEEKNGTE